ncbi:LysR family transcriptional regulator [Aliagarivorans marinus]|uniref:LysR family transcriptional regulator n=1 Tax=Aliagarivorans marinus TaxID=561965 RepID=UPI0003F63A2D|nr:LysR family transcriptional regulator [Aliagarivorans marinus]
MASRYLSSRTPIVDKIIFFCAVIESGSFREAAKQQGVSAAAGSRWVKELEQHLGTELIKRSTRTMLTTQAGELLYQRFSKLLPEIDAICAEVENLSQQQRGEIRLSSTPLFAQQYLSTIVSEYMQHHPKVDFKLFIEAGDFDPLKVDFAFRAKASYRGQSEQDSLLVSRHLLSEPLYLCAAPDYLQANGTPQSPEQLAQHRCLYAHTLVGGNRWCFERDGEATMVDISDALQCDNSAMLLDFALHGAGIAYLPHSLVVDHLARGDLISVMDQYMWVTFDVRMYYRPRHPMPERCQQFKQYLLTRLEALREQGEQAIRA